MTIFELYCGATNNRKRNDIDILCKFVNILNIDKETGQFAANLYLNLKDRGFSIGTEDLLIAANALQYNLSVLTLNKKHFNKVENLKLI
ncbi:MAG: type II toxin-antitoxin system VapC family toxin [Ignavibacteria bacterium]|nr:type II toxin-antitoxin system VapC family toxin [Ignavibacteria bacterium]